MQRVTYSKEATQKIKTLLDKTNDTSLITDHLMAAVKAGGNPNIQGQNGNTILHRFAVDKINPELITALVKTYNAKLNIKNKAGKTPLHALMDTNCIIHDVMTLVRLGADPDTKDSNGNPLLNRLVLSNASAKVIEEFINEHHGNVNIKDFEGETSLQILMNSNCTVKQALQLVQLGADPTTKDKHGTSLLERFKASNAPAEIIHELEQAIEKKLANNHKSNPRSASAINTGEYTYTSISQWHEPKVGREKKQQEKLDKANLERQEKMEEVRDIIFKL